MATKSFEKAVELATGVSVEVLRDTPVDERRSTIERALGRPLRFPSRFPLIGRGNVLRDRAVSHDEVEEQFMRVVHGKQKT